MFSCAGRCSLADDLSRRCVVQRKRKRDCDGSYSYPEGNKAITQPPRLARFVTPLLFLCTVAMAVGREAALQLADETRALAAKWRENGMVSSLGLFGQYPVSISPCGLCRLLPLSLSLSLSPLFLAFGMCLCVCGAMCCSRRCEAVLLCGLW